MNFNFNWRQLPVLILKLCIGIGYNNRCLGSLCMLQSFELLINTQPNPFYISFY